MKSSGMYEKEWKLAEYSGNESNENQRNILKKNGNQRNIGENNIIKASGILCRRK